MTPMSRREQGSKRLGAALAVAFIHGVIGYLLISGLAFDVVRRTSEALSVISVREEVPTIELTQPVQAPDETVAGGASTSVETAKAATEPPAPVVIAPPPVVQLETRSPIIVAPASGPGKSVVPAPAGQGSGIGAGAGAGAGAGDGNAGSRNEPAQQQGTRAQFLAGVIMGSDYPRAAIRAKAEGTTRVRFTVEANGRVSACTVTKSSGNADLDAVTCRLIERRYRYRPARDPTGKPVSEVKDDRYVWRLPGIG